MGGWGFGSYNPIRFAERINIALSWGLGSLNPVHIVQQVNNSVVKPAVQTAETVVSKVVQSPLVDPLKIGQKVNNSVVKPVVKTTQNAVHKARDVTESALAASAAPLTFNQAQFLTAKSAQRSTVGKVASKFGKAEVIGTAVVVGAYEAPAIGATVKTAATALKTAALAKAIASKPAQPASLSPAAPAPAPAATPNPAKAGLWLTGAVALLQFL